MTEPRVESRWRGPAGVGLLAALFTVLTGAAALMMFSRFMLYDDEGYVLLSLRNFAEHGGLYRDVYSQYGPLPYVLYWLLHVLGAPLTHTVGRLVTVAAWCGAALGAGAFVWRLSRSYTLVAATVAAVFVYLWVMVSEPTHPGGLITLLTALLAALGAGRLVAERWSGWSALVGAGVAALVLTKINVGVFAGISAVAFALLHHRSPAAQRWMPWLVAAGFAALPFALMRTLLHAPWVQTYATIYAFGAAAAAGAIAVGRRPVVGGREIRNFLLGALAVGIVVVGVVLARGSSPGDLLEGMLLGPLRHPASFSLAFKWAPGSLAVAVASAALFAVVRWQHGLGRAETTERLVASLRLIAAAALALGILRFPAISADNLVLAYGTSCLWIFLWPLRGETPAVVAARAWVGVLLLGQFLHPFPVPGSQIAWGTFLVIPLAAVAAWQAILRLAPRVRPLSTPLALAARAGSLALALLAGSVGWKLAQVGRLYQVGRNLELPGAEHVRLPDESTARYQVLCFNALAHADMVFSLPGMFSFNLWTGLPTPTRTNVTHWFSLLSPAQQQEIIRVLEAHPRTAVIVETGHVDFLRQRGLAPAGVLYDYLEKNFRPAFAIDGFEFRVREGRRVAAFLMAEVFTRPPAEGIAPGAPDPESSRLVLPLSLPPNQMLTRVEILSVAGHMAPLVLDATNTRVEVTPITLAGEPRGAPQPATLPLKFTGAASVALYFDASRRPFDLRDTLIVLRGTDDAELGLVRLRP